MSSYRLDKTIVGPEFVGFVDSMCDAAPAKLGEVELYFREPIGRADIIQEMMNSFRRSCPFYKLKM